MKCFQFIGLAIALSLVSSTIGEIVSPASAQSTQETIGQITTLLERVDRLAREYSTASIIGALIALFGTVLGHRLTGNIGKAQREHERSLAHEAHTMSLVSQLGHVSLPVRMASATLLFNRIRRAKRNGGFLRRHRTGSQEGMILQVLVSVTKEDKPDANLAKLIGDELVRVRRALLEKGRQPSARTVSPLQAVGGDKLDLQYVKFVNVFWPRVDARGVDFYGSDFSRAGLRGAFLKDAIFCGACLKDCVLSNSDLQGADLRGAILEGANLEGANLSGANLKGAKADERTVWPDGFDTRRLSL